MVAVPDVPYLADESVEMRTVRVKGGEGAWLYKTAATYQARSLDCRSGYRVMRGPSGVYLQLVRARCILQFFPG